MMPGLVTTRPALLKTALLPPLLQVIDYDALFRINSSACMLCGTGKRHVMSMGSRLAEHPRAILICQVLGFCIFAAAFFLPAVKGSGGLTDPDIFKGWECAKIALTATFHLDTYESSVFLAAMGGWINPLVLLYICLSLAPKFSRLRRFPAVAILVCMVATWIFFAVDQLIPIIGHFLWIAGALMILVAELSGGKPEAVVP